MKVDNSSNRYQLVRVKDLRCWQNADLVVSRRWQRWNDAISRSRLRMPPARLFVCTESIPKIDSDKISKIVKGLNKAAHDLIYKAFHYANKVFEGKSRKSGRPAIDHLVNTALFLREIMEVKDPALLAAGILHDIIEDTERDPAPIARGDLEQEFGHEVADLVEAETKLSKELEWKYRTVMSLKKWINALMEDPRVALLKAADNLDNMQDQEVFSPEEIIEHAQETQEIYVPVMDALGVWEMRIRLENRALFYLYPKVYREISKLYDLQTEETKKKLENFASDLKKALIDRGIPCSRVAVNERYISEVNRKMNREGKSAKKMIEANPLFLNYILVEINDKDPKVCWEAMAALRERCIHDFKPVDQKVVDYLYKPRPNGYRALQTYLYEEGKPDRLLVTVTTREIDRVNRLGFAATRTKDYDWLTRLENYIGDVSSPKEFRERIVESAYRMTVWSSDGKEIKIPIESTVLDYAFVKDLDRALKVKRVKVNGKEVPLGRRLAEGDRVEIIYGEKISARPIWLSWVDTTEAVDRMMEFLRAEKRERTSTEMTQWGVQAINEAIDKEAPHYYLRWNDIIQVGWLTEFLDRVNKRFELELQEDKDLVSEVVMGQIDLVETAKIFVDCYRQVLNAKRQQAEENQRIYVFQIRVPNRQGIWQKITKRIGKLGINIEDHGTTYLGQKREESVITIAVSHYDSIQRAQIEKALEEFGQIYPVELVLPSVFLGIVTDPQDPQKTEIRKRKK